jgi:hypothetical protein
MSVLVASLSAEKNSWTELSKILHSKFFTDAYLVTDTITDSSGMKDYSKPIINGVKIEIISLDFRKASEDLVPELYMILKKKFTEQKIQELDIAVNITSGTGKEHSVIISTLMKLGYGIRLIDLDKNGNILEMI